MYIKIFLILDADCQTLSLAQPGSDYVGDTMNTVSGLECQNWKSQSPHRHQYSHYGNHKFCRNDKGDREGVWCYTMDSDIEWEYCSQVRDCEAQGQ